MTAIALLHWYLSLVLFLALCWIAWCLHATYENKFRMKWIRTGATRRVLLIGEIAIKVPTVRSWGLFLYGLLGNMQERNFSRTGWKQLCPVLFALPGGFLLVMRRARPLVLIDWHEFDYDRFVDQPDYRVPAEEKMDSFGWLDGRIVAVDYGTVT